MRVELNAQTSGKHEIVTSLDREFARLHLNSCALVESTPADVLYKAAEAMTFSGSELRASSVGESILRSAATIEQTFGGITANLWDDPFEWTLPEYLSTPAAVIDYLGDVEATRRRAFSSFSDDDCLGKLVMTPAGSVPLVDLLRETLRRATALQAYALVRLKALSGISPGGFII